jgi:hypothetical protein
MSRPHDAADLHPPIGDRTATATPAARGRWVDGAVAGRMALAGIVVGALLLRLLWQWPPSQAAVQAPYDDEGVYVMGAQLLRQGYLPYRDFFFAHPPLGLALLTPAVSVFYTPWGSGLSFGLTRLLVAVMGAASVALVGLAAARVWGLGGGLIAAALLAIDPASVANSRHILLETPMTLLLAAAIWAAVVLPDERRGALATGLLAGLAALVKMQAATFWLAYVAMQALRRRWEQVWASVAGGVAAALMLALTALVVEPDRLVRQVVLFQVLRPPDGVEALPDRLAGLLSPTGALLGLTAGLAGLLVAWRAGQRAALTRCLPVIVWVGLGLASFVLSRSFYPHYASQLMPGLALLGGGLAMGLAAAARRLWPARAGLAGLSAVLIGIAALGLLPVIAPQPDRLFTVVGRYLSDALPPDRPALATDVQFNYLAARPLPMVDGAFLVDSYGQLIYAGLGLDEGDLLTAARTANARRAGATVHEIMWRPQAQALLRDHMAVAEIVVVHDVGRGRLTEATRAWLAEHYELVEATSRYEIYRRVS